MLSDEQIYEYERIASIRHRKHTKKWIRVPVKEKLEVAHCWEHTPLDYYRYGEYPRFVRPVGAHKPMIEWKLVENNDFTFIPD